MQIKENVNASRFDLFILSAWVCLRFVEIDETIEEKIKGRFTVDFLIFSFAFY